MPGVRRAGGAQERGGGAALLDRVVGGSGDIGEGFDRDGAGLGVLELEAGVRERGEGAQVVAEGIIVDEREELVGCERPGEGGEIEVGGEEGGEEGRGSRGWGGGSGGGGRIDGGPLSKRGGARGRVCEVGGVEGDHDTGNVRWTWGCARGFVRFLFGVGWKDVVKQWSGAAVTVDDVHEGWVERNLR